MDDLLLDFLKNSFDLEQLSRFFEEAKKRPQNTTELVTTSLTSTPATSEAGTSSVSEEYSVEDPKTPTTAADLFIEPKTTLTASDLFGAPKKDPPQEKPSILDLFGPKSVPKPPALTDWWLDNVERNEPV